MTSQFVNVGRSTPWGNPYVLGEMCPRCMDVHGKRGSTIACFTEYAKRRLEQEPRWLEPLAGRILWCPGCVPNAETCHARVLERLRPLRIDGDFF